MSGTRRARPSPGAAITSSPWIVVSIGVIVMVVLLVVALGSARARRTYTDGAPPEPAMSLPELPVAATSAPPSSGTTPVPPVPLPESTVVLPTRSTPSRSAGATTGSRPASSSAPPPAVLVAPSAPSPVTGRYREVEAFHGGFIGEVLLVNRGDRPSGWTVTLNFERGRVTSSWVESAEQGTASFADGVFTYRSGVDLAPGASVALRFHVERSGNSGPTSCLVGATECAGR
ncbi:cellulose binding domain-containing protein [Micromonospora eburnea]|uniref:Cellulose binding domain-containing protein n=1 Tax=Micromonospora eburnea TaxID=227316 RepID=A0A1C6V3U8_9ACTN|nr:cellulose binding domain-containing protein [Micromonospora eburnea]SCL60966.1 Cellulose binding domain-containing protein [Micromonospora eburnea]